MKSKSYVAIVVVLLCLFSSSLYAQIVTPYIQGSSTATLLDSGDYAGMYLYEIDVEWDLGDSAPDLSHWDIILRQDCANTDHLIWFDSPAGFSTSVGFPSDPNALGWTGYFERKGDPSLDEESGPVVKYDNPFYPESAEPAAIGYGTFFFYSNIKPELGIYDDVLVGKAGNIPDVYGDLSGDYPSCTHMPEPATICMLGMGGGLLLMRKK